MEPNYSFGKWIQRQRKAREMTQEQLAECVGCSLVMIRKIERDERRPSEQITLRLADCFEIALAERPLLIKVARRQLSADRLPSGGRAAPPSVAQIGVITPQARSIPSQITQFVGRAAELRQVTERLSQPNCRLLTLLGPGGIGKTRLAVQAAGKVKGFADGIFYAPLASVISSEYLALTIAGALHVQIAASADPAVALGDYLVGRELLLVLDNFEHLLEGAGLLSEIMERAPQVKLLVTSREPLALYGEWLHPIEGLSFPQNGDYGKYPSYDAVRLFVESAARISPHFALDEHAADVGRICRLVEGNPLGIELAAAQLRVFSCREIAERILSDIDVLSATLRNVPERHRSMRGVFDHSWNLLTVEQQTAMARLSVFRGGFSLKAAEQIAGADRAVLAALIDKSLVRVQGADRYDLHELLRQYSDEKLAADPDLHAATGQAHSAYYAAFLHQLGEPARQRAEQPVLDEIDIDLQNILTAWQYALIYRQTDHLEQAINPLHNYCIARARFHESRMAFQGVVDTFGEDNPDPAAQRVLVLALSRLSHMQFAQGGDPNRARMLVERSLSMARELGWRSEEALALSLAGLCAHTVDEAHLLFEQALEAFREVKYDTGISDVCQNLGLATAAQGRYSLAMQHFGESTAIALEGGDAWGANVGYFYLGKVAAMMGKFEEARQHLSKSLAFSRQNDFRLGIGENTAEFGILMAWKFEDYPAADALLRESMSMFAEIGPRPARTAIVQAYLGSALSAMGQHQEAEDWLIDAARATQKITYGQAIIAAETLTHLGMLMFRTGRYQQALDLFAVVHHANEAGALTDRDLHPVALQEIRLRIELAAVTQRLQVAMTALRAHLVDHYGVEAVADALKTACARTVDEVIQALV